MPRSTLRLALVLGLLSCVGPFAVDMVLPALPAVAEELGASIPAAQGTLTAFFLAFGVSQLAWGPWSDQVGRRRPLLLGLAVFILGSVACALAPTVGSLTAARFVQGIGASVVMVVPRAVIRDTSIGTAATGLMALVMLVISVSPMLAPLVGSGVIALGGWRAVFWALCLAALASAALTLALLPETLPAERRAPLRPRALAGAARRLLLDPTFMGLTFISGFGFASFFVFLASASFVCTQSYGLSPVGFSLAFAVNALGFFAASQAAAPLGERLGPARVVAWGVAGFAGFALLLVPVALAGLASLPVLVGGLFLANACLGLVIPTAMVMALDPHGEVAGLASSLGGTLQMLAGGAVVIAAGPFFDGTATPMVVAIAACAVVALALAWLVLGRPAGRARRATS